MLHVAVQLATEKAAVTPAGNDDAENATEAGEPDRRRTVTPSAADWPCITESVEVAADNEIAVDKAAVVKLESGDTVTPPLEFVELTRK